ncbi:MAG TPA: BsuPI-related putative proteinase inhibitor [Mycobacteriales bacterium]|nr:BsuPI-related putative proteinase inhibitor [Mycobacteriales bacterium]
MTSPDPLRRPAVLAASRGREPRLADFNAAMTEGRRRRLRRGLRSAGAGAALAAVVGVTVGLGGGIGGVNAQDEIRFVEQTPDSPAEQFDRQSDDAGMPALGLPPAGLPPADEQRSGRGLGRSADRGDDADFGPTRLQPHPRRPAYRTKSSSLVPRTCATSVDWCLHATVRSGGKGKGHNLHATLCLNAKQPFGSLDFATAQEADFEVLAGSRVIWRWSDGQAFARDPHQLSGIPGDCFAWQTYWDQYDGNGAKFGAARLSLRVRSLASQETSPASAEVPFTTVAF